MTDWNREERRQPPADSGNRLILEVPRNGNLDQVLRLLVEAVAQGGGVQFPDLGFINAKLDLTLGLLEGARGAIPAINNLTELVKEKFMGLKEDNATLASKFDSMETAVQAVADDIAALKNELKDANERANIDLTPLISRADGLETRLRAAAGPNAGTDPDAEPLPEPGGDTGGGTTA